MKVREGLDIQTADFWYDLMEGGYLKIEEILENDEDIRDVEAAIIVLKEFAEACEDGIDDFIQ